MTTITRTQVQVGGSRWAEFLLHLEGPKLTTFSSFIRLVKA